MADPAIISIHYGHNATVGLLQGNTLTDCVSEERFNRIKNSTGFPSLALAYIEKQLGRKADYYVFSGETPSGYDYLKKYGFATRTYGQYWDDTRPARVSWHWRLRTALRKRFRPGAITSEAEMQSGFARLADIPESKVLFVNHHLSHALSTRFFVPDQKKKTLVFTLDAEGDGLCATVTIMDATSRNIIATTDRTQSLGYLYSWVTLFLGMKSNEHEFKVMGLAPYAKTEWVEKILPFFKKLLWLENGAFHSRTNLMHLRHEMQEHLTGKRFDTIAGAVQTFTEDIVTEWVQYWITKTAIHNIALAGGVFMNVKLNQKIAALPEVSSCTITPSAADESLVFGGCYFGLTHQSAPGTAVYVEPISSLYLGNSYSDVAIEALIKERRLADTYIVSKPDNMAHEIAHLLAENHVIARFAGRMEFGARALGNRSILANPSHFDTVRVINEMIKNRDFWMPFAASITAEAADRYLINPRGLDGSHMAITFDTTPIALEHLPAALHPYDKTCRAQIVRSSSNPEYHHIITEFEKLTGMGVVLNTSFNLHGEPNVESPNDALYTLEHSGLSHLALGSYLITKKSNH